MSHAELITERDGAVTRLLALEGDICSLEDGDSDTYELALMLQEEVNSLLSVFDETTITLQKFNVFDPEYFSKVKRDFRRLLVKLKGVIKAHRPSTPAVNRAVSPVDENPAHCQIIDDASVDDPNDIQGQNQVTSNVPTQNQIINVKLPDIPIPNFDGQFNDWLHFRETFNAIIIQNPALPEVTKFYYLRQSLSGEALARIANIAPGNTNFKIAWKLLSERYDNPRLVATSHVHAIENPPSVVPNSATSLRCFIDHCKGHIHALESIELDMDVKDLLYMHRILSHLDPNTLRDWEQSVPVAIIPSMEQLWEFLENRCKVWEVLLANKPYPVKIKSETKPVMMNSTSNPNMHSSFNNSHQCLKCRERHFLFQCPSFKALQPVSRFEFAKNLKLCYNCLMQYKQGHKCSTRSCFYCQQNHHSLLHEAFKSRVNNTSRVHVNIAKQHDTGSYDSRDHSIPHCTQDFNSQRCSKSDQPTTSSIQAYDNGGEAINHSVNDSQVTEALKVALLDSGSDCNLISKSAIKTLNVDTTTRVTSIHGVGNGSSLLSKSANIFITSQDHKWNSKLTCLVVDQITSNLPSTDLDLSAFTIPSNISLADPQFHMSSSIDLLLGASIFAQILLPGNIVLSDSTPVFQNSKFGFFVMGPIPGSDDFNQTDFQSNFISAHPVADQLERFWQIEELPLVPNIKPEEKAAEDSYISTTVRDQDGRYIVSLPKKAPIEQLGNSKVQALKRFSSLEHRLAKSPELREQYVNFMIEYESLGHMSLLDFSTPENSVYYIPHHPVFKPDSSTTKLRVVFDASAKTSSLKSLNDILHVGPTIQPELFDIILRFRCHLVAIAADVTKMYRQILVQPSDRDLQRIFWRSSPADILKQYTLNTVTYGTAPAAFLATRTLKQLAIDEANDLPEASRAITEDFYVDDLLSGAPSVSQAINLANLLRSTLEKGGFELRKWLSNSSEVLQSIPTELHEVDVTKLIAGDFDTSFKTLGLIWNVQSDNLSISSNQTYEKTVFTKREFLSSVASIFDPLGLVAPVVISAKILFQQLWLFRLDWDDKLPGDLLQQWLEIFQQLPKTNKIAIPRCIVSPQSCNFQIHGFCDASIKAYGACVYLRSLDNSNNVVIHLLCSKSRVAPLKPTSIPRLELLGAVLLSRLVNRVLSTLRLPISSTHLWTDSQNVCSWIKSPPDRKNIFVSVRIDEIQDTTKSFQWHHIKSAQNPADIISRGLQPTELCSSSMWWHGPAFLQDAQDFDSSDSSVISMHISSSNVVKKSAPTDPILSKILNRFSSLSKVIWITAWCFRFIFNCTHQDQPLQGLLSIEELSKAEFELIRFVQLEAFSSELQSLKQKEPLSPKSNLLPFCPFLDARGIIRLGGRLQNSKLSFDNKHQILIPAKHRFTKLLILATHYRLMHAGLQIVMADIRSRFWLPSSRNTIRNVLRSCIPCFKYSPKLAQQQLGQLPECRITPNPPFSNCGVDYAGPISVRVGGPKSRTTSKAYLALFVCMSTRCVHCEIVTELTTKAFIAALTRFISRRGFPSCIYSDNATNFVGANSELSDLSHFLQNSETQSVLQTAAAKSHIQWHFIPPRAPHFGGLWEAAIKSFKTIFRKATNVSILTLEELFTLSSQVEAILNSRPMIPLTEDPNDFNYLSPGHFLIGRPLTALPIHATQNDKRNLLARWKQIELLSQQIWKCWQDNYLVLLQKRNKWLTENENLKLNTVVLIKEDNVPIGSWRMGRITETFPGKDGKVRVVMVRTMSGSYKKAIHSLAPLPLDDNIEA